jgi:hypothetical protein
MAGNSITTMTALACPHGGTVAIVSTNAQVAAGGAPLARATDTFTISGCPFQIPVGVGTVPSPCVRVQWILADLRDKTNGSLGLSQGSVGLCLAATQVPQGPVSVVATQPKASST